MPTAALLMLQVASAMGPVAATEPAAGGSIAQPVAPKTCAAKADEIVVCGKDADSYRLPKGVAPGVEGALPKAEWKIFGEVKAGVGFDQRNVGGYPSNAVMATIKIPF